MIGSLRGDVLRVGESEAIIDVGGVGYRVVATASTLGALRAAEGSVLISVHTHVREDALVLYGFITDQEREVFEVLLGTHGVGPTLALAILGALGSSTVIEAVQLGDLVAFEQVPGVGKKTAARLVLELQGSLGDRFEPSVASADRTASNGRADVQAALGELGYTSEEIRQATSVLDGTESVEQAIRISLRELSRP